MILPSEVTRNRATPTSMPTARPAGGSAMGSISVTTTTNQRRFLASQLESLDPAFSLAVLSHLESTDHLKAGVRPPTVDGRFPLGAVPDDEEHLVVSPIRLEPRVADPHFGVIALLPRQAPPLLLGFPDSPAEGSKDCVEPSEGLLLGGERVPALARWVVHADVPELSRLIGVANRL